MSWHYQSYRHSLAARGIQTKRYSNMAKVYRDNVLVPDKIKDMSSKLKESGVTGVYAVGGYVRDKLLGRDPKDLDIEVHGKSIDQVKEILEAQGYKVDSVGKSFGVLKVKVGDEYIDVAVPRQDTSGRKPEVTFLENPTPEEAAKRRDLTINAIMYNVNTGELVDPYGGISDLEADNIRAVSQESFNEDPLRVLRAAQFASRFGFKVDPETTELARKVDASGMSGERIKDELEKALLKSERPSVFFDELDRMGQLDRVFPELAALKDTPNDTTFHPGEETVYKHTMRVLDRAAQGGADREVLLAAILHDTGKAGTSVDKGNGRVSAIGHEEVSEQNARRFFDRLKFDNATSEDVTKAVRMHMKPHFLARENDKQALKYINRLMVDFAGGVSNLRSNPEIAYARFRRAMDLAKADKGNNPERYDKILESLPPLDHYRKRINANPYIERGLKGKQISDAVNNTYLNEINMEDVK